MLSFFKEFLLFLIQRRKIWLIPLFLAMALVGSFIVLTEGTAIAPFIYTVF
ncbi:MAG: DUF5989 family protein [Pseudomonadota bacterium]